MPLDAEHFIKIPGTKTTISPTQEYSGFKYDEYIGFNYNDTHFELARNGLYMPTPFEFFTHRNNVIEAYDGKSELFYATDEKVSEKKVEEIYHTLMWDCWVWLNSKFVRGSWFKKLDLETVVDVEDGRLITEKEQLQECIKKNCYVDLKLNKQGFPTNKSRKQKLIREKNIHYYYPKKNAVPWFAAGSGGVVLDCNGDPLSSNLALGVFPCNKSRGLKPCVLVHLSYSS